MKIGIYGGSFDPIHNGHLQLALAARQEYNLDLVWLMPAGHSPNKNEADMLPAAERIKMAQLAAAEYEGLSVSSLEADAEERSYTYRTLQKMHELYQKDELYFLLGSDSLDYLERWVQPQIICDLAVLLVAVRGGEPVNRTEEKIDWLKNSFSADIRLIHADICDISSSLIKKKLSDKEDVSRLLAEPVRRYILDHRLYGA